MNLLPAFVIGLLGSLHCLGMCGPIALALPVPPGKNRTLRILVYNLGRVCTYLLLGAIMGAFGQTMGWMVGQQYLSIGCGVLILAILLLHYLGKHPRLGLPLLSDRVKAGFGRLIRLQSMGSYLWLGMLNGLLPCGLVYMALVASVATGGIGKSMAFMALFGMGTLPMMLAIAQARQLFQGSWQARTKKYMTAFVFLTGCLLIVRGLNLGIPYVSPKTEEAKGMSCCSMKHH